MPTKSAIKPLGVERTEAIDAARPVEQNDPHHASQTYAGQATDTYRAVRPLLARVPVLLAEQIMSTPVVTVSPDASVADALREFQTQGFRHVPVALASGRLVGIVSERDILRHLASLAADRQFATPLANTPVEQLMVPEVLTAHVDTDVRYIARVFVQRRIGAMPIVDDEDAARGIICRSDLLRAVMQHYALELWA